LSRFRVEVVRPNNIWFGVVHGLMNRVAHKLAASTTFLKKKKI